MRTVLSDIELAILDRQGLLASEAATKLRDVLILSTTAQKFSPLSNDEFFRAYRDLCGVHNDMNISDLRILGMIHLLACKGLGNPGAQLHWILKVMLKPEYRAIEDQIEIDFSKFTMNHAELIRRFGVHSAPYVDVLRSDWSKVLEFEELITAENK